jgi:hypothetical protein
VDNEELIESILEKSAKDVYPTLQPLFKLYFSIDSLKDWAKEQIKTRFDSLYEMLNVHLNKEQLQNQIINQFLTLISNYIGILSLSRINNNMLLWSHYSNCHQGIVIELDEKHPYLSQFDDNIYHSNIEIEYTDIRPNLIINTEDISQNNALEIAKNILFTKSKDWCYEQEYRLIRILVNATVLPTKDKNGYDIYVFDFPVEIVKAIIFGCRVNEDKKVQMKNLLNQNGYESIEIKQAVLSDDKFLLDIR